MSASQSSILENLDAVPFSYMEWREKFLRLILRGTAIIGLFVAIAGSVDTEAILVAVYAVSYLIVLFIALVPLSYRVRALGFLIVLLTMAVASLFQTGVRVEARLFLLVFVTMTAMLFGVRAGIIAAVIGFIPVFVMGYFILTGQYTIMSKTVGGNDELITWIVAVLLLVMIETLILAGLAMLQRGFSTALQQSQQLLNVVQMERATLEQRVEERTAQIRTSAEVGQAAAATLEPGQILRQVVDLITDRFGFYYAAVFTLNETGTAVVLREATGEAGRELKKRGHQLEANGRSMVGYAVTQRRPRIAANVDLDPVRYANPLLPNTRSEIALPLIASNRVLGALDVQSTQEAAFDEASAAVLQTMADQIAVALNNAEQFKQTELQARQQSGLNQFSRSLYAASTVEALYEVLAIQLNSILPHDYLSLVYTESGSTSLREYPLQAGADPVLTEGPVWAITNTLSGRACTTRQPVVSTRLIQDAALADATSLLQAGFQSALSLPLLVGERVLGTLNFASRTPNAFSQFNSAQLEQLAGQIAVALENQRLAQAQQKSLRDMEALTRQLTGKAWSKRQQRLANPVESVQYVRSGVSTNLPTMLPEIEAAMEQRAPIARSEHRDPHNPSPHEAILATPIVLRGEVLGALQVSEAHATREWTKDDMTFIQAVADQVALALDNARLIEETEQRAERERVVADISSRMFAANDLETIVQIAGEELGRILRARQTTIQVRSDLAEAAAQPGDGQRPDRHE